MRFQKKNIRNSYRIIDTLEGNFFSVCVLLTLVQSDPAVPRMNAVPEAQGCSSSAQSQLLYALLLLEKTSKQADQQKCVTSQAPVSHLENEEFVPVGLNLHVESALKMCHAAGAGWWTESWGHETRLKL